MMLLYTSALDICTYSTVCAQQVQPLEACPGDLVHQVLCGQNLLHEPVQTDACGAPNSLCSRSMHIFLLGKLYALVRKNLQGANGVLSYRSICRLRTGI